MRRRQSLEAKREYNRQRYWRNREKILAQQKERYERDKETILSKDKIYYEKNKEKIKERAALHYQENKERVKQRERQRRFDRKIAAMNILGKLSCPCGENHPAALDFHHRDPAEKLFSIGDMLMSSGQISEDDFITEIKKCDLICKNCHAKEHCQWMI